MILLYLYLGFRSENTRDRLTRLRTRIAARFRRQPKYTGHHTEEWLDDDWADYLDQQILKPEDPAGYLAPIRYHANPAILANANIARGIANQQTADRQARAIGSLIDVARTVTGTCWTPRDPAHLAPIDWRDATDSFRKLVLT